MLSRLGIRGKILAVVAVPILVLVVVAAAVTAAAGQDLRAAQNVSQLVNVMAVASPLQEGLQEERRLSADYAHFTRFEAATREEAEQAVDALYLAVLSAASNAPAEQRAQARSASREVSSMLGLRVSGGEVVSVLAVPDAEREGLYALRGLEPVTPTSEEIQEYEERTGEEYVHQWPEWPSAAAVQAMDAEYADVRQRLGETAQDLPASSTMRQRLDQLNQALANEALVASQYLGESPQREQEIDAAASTTDARLSEFAEVSGAIANRLENRALIDVVRNLQVNLDTLPSLRESVRNGSLTPVLVQGSYSRSITGLLSLPRLGSQALTDRSIAQAMVAYADVNEVVDRLLLEEIVYRQVLRQQTITSDERETVRTMIVQTDLAVQTARASSLVVPGIQAVPTLGASQALATQDFGFVRNVVSVRTEAEIPLASGINLEAMVNAEIQAMTPSLQGLWTRVETLTAEQQRASLLQALLTALGAVAVVAASFLIALLIARRIVGPLRRLTTTATAVRQELPRLVERVALPGQSVDVSEVQIPVESSDEIGRLAEAFNAVNAATLSIAGEQAALRGSISEMFVNVARRDQVLLNRQLASIDEMERTQEDAETLRRLFALDHLATRMRRNSESLLVLAGIDTGRRMRRPMPLSDVIRTASSEIELYERIQLELDVDPSMLGHSALTAAHLFAELLENATVFSDPGTPVVVRTSKQGDGFVVEIIDQGIGMNEDELREANQRVISTAASEILGAQRLGLFVVGRIARRVGAQVVLSSQEGKGTTATVTMPASLFDASADSVVPADEEEGAVEPDLHSLLELDDDAEVAEDAEVVPDTVQADDGDSIPMPVSTDDIEALIAADAGASPVADEVDLGELTAGRTPGGLPVRRKRSAGTESAPAPAAPATGPIPVSPSEVAPQTAEQRASVFRGFRSRRDEDDDQPDGQFEGAEDEALPAGSSEPQASPDRDLAASLSGSREGGVDDQVDGEADGDVPVLEEELDTPGEALSSEADESPDAEEGREEGHEGDAEPLIAGDNGGNQDVSTDGDDVNDGQQQDPRIQAGFFEEPFPATGEQAAFPTAPIPGLEPDPEPATAANQQVPSTWAFQPSEPTPEPTPEPSQEYPVYPAEQQMSPVDMLAQGIRAPHAPDLRAEELSVADPSAAAPSLSAVLGADVDAALDGKGGKKKGRRGLFGRRRGEAEAPADSAPIPGPAFVQPFESAAEYAVEPEFGSIPEYVPTVPAPAIHEEQTAPEQVPYAEPAAHAEPTGYAEPAAYPEQAGYAAEPAAYPEPTPYSAEQPTAYAEPAAYTEPAYEQPVYGQAPQWGYEEQPGYDAFGFPGDHVPQGLSRYSPDQLAQPFGWEHAGADAVQATVADLGYGGYSPQAFEAAPVVEEYYEEADVATAAFSELSSLAAERPKVERTRAGLARRAKAELPPEPAIQAPPPDEAPLVQRDADAVRHRFSSFYDATSRARADAAAFEAQVQGASHDGVKP